MSRYATRCKNCNAYNETVCRRYPPGLLPNQIRVWPTVDPEEDWCGEFDLKADLLMELIMLDEADRKWWEFWK